ncbi:MAG: bifunctional adenosylcobinamide kinase/adenosylcobinamide-phosphate guanylyltransferase [Nocardioidaceae bacterium]|nr:bifunctional adenosylcobinamide kinase/adenosylcobinamide-phosphate guanylyltransferase [Nocardioidaceae bacterium]
MKTLVTGGVRAGKSLHAEGLLAAHPAVTYVVPGPVHDDAEWAARVAELRRRRPPSWTTLETGDLAEALWTPGPVLVDSLGTWLTRLVDEAGMWDARAEDLASYVDEEAGAALAALTRTDADRVLVTSEVGLGIIPEHRSGRLYRDLLGTLNQRFAAACDEVHLVVAGRALVL